MLGCGRALHRAIDLVGVGQRHLRLDLAGRRVEHVAEAAAGPVDPLAADEMIEVVGHWMLLSRKFIFCVTPARPAGTLCAILRR
jgi:hypothetical protein